ncbi:MAG: hypothetical protein LBM09_01325 [Candidatus Nomurabacteria bacterium]|jgi:transcriptional regulator NrdR family protein|nr:hypothetical protein [Candidatus Nomurabacteria bacterium]
MAYVVGSDKDFDKTRLAKAVHRSAVANSMPTGQAENFARYVVERVEKWIQDKAEITASELRLQTVATMAEYDSDVAYLYENENKIF